MHIIQCCLKLLDTMMLNDTPSTSNIWRHYSLFLTTVFRCIGHVHPMVTWKWSSLNNLPGTEGEQRRSSTLAFTSARGGGWVNATPQPHYRGQEMTRYHFMGVGAWMVRTVRKISPPYWHSIPGPSSGARRPGKGIGINCYPIPFWRGLVLWPQTGEIFF
jgi:hypothetical protein